MMRRFLRSSIHNATVTHADSELPVSLRLDPLVMIAAGLLPREEVEIVVAGTGDRITTYVEPGSSGEVRVHSAVAHHVRAGDVISILSWGLLHDGQTLAHTAKLVSVDGANRVVTLVEAASAPET
jgi:aspartate 1-decarboxylase